MIVMRSILYSLTVTAMLGAQVAAQSTDSTSVRAMARLANALAGSWNTVEVVQNGNPVPAGAGRRGHIGARLVGGGTALVGEGHAVGPAGGDLRWFMTFWWDAQAQRYRLLTCFRAANDAGCELRGTAHWEGDTFVNAYSEPVNGTPTRMEDRWTRITPNSYTLTEWHDAGGSSMKPYVVSHVTRE